MPRVTSWFIFGWLGTELPSHSVPLLLPSPRLQDTTAAACLHVNGRPLSRCPDDAIASALRIPPPPPPAASDAAAISVAHASTAAAGGRERSTGRSYRSPPRPGPRLSAVPPSTNRRPPSITTSRAPPARPISIHNSPSRHPVGGATVSAARQLQRQRPLRPVGKRRRVFGADKVSECRLRAAAIFSLSPCWRSAAPATTDRRCDYRATRPPRGVRLRPDDDRRD